jgi:lipopolysaccharide transport system permease protein/teichoic acid transport system permease protein
VKKVDFRLSILPIVKILSALVPHIFFLLIATVICWINGFAPSLYIFQVFYYLGAMIFLLLGLSWITSSTSLFVKDVIRLVSIITQFGFWLTPIFWNIKMIPGQYQWIIKLNPIHYIVNGYRDSLINNIPFWEHPYETLYFWLVTLCAMYVGITIFGKLRPHFAEVI